MWRHRGELREQVQEAARHADPEVAGRAKWVLRQWQRGAVPGMPLKISRLLQSDDPASIEELLEYGQFRAAVVAVEESRGTVNFDALQDRLSKALTHRFPVYVSTAHQQGTLADVVRLVDLTATSPEMAVCRLELMRRLGMEIQPGEALLPTAAEIWPKALKDQAMTLVLFSLDRVDEAIEFAERTSDDELIASTLVLAGRWNDAAHHHAQLAKGADVDALERIRHWANVLMTADRAGNQELVNQAVDVLTSDLGSIDETMSRDFGIRLRWKSLALQGFVEEALEIVQKVSVTSAVEVAMASSQTDKALRALEFSFDDITANLDEWLGQTINDQLAASSETLVPAMRRTLSLMRLYALIGYDKQSLTIATRLAEDRRLSEFNLRSWVLFYLSMTNKQEWVIDLAVQPGERQLPRGAGDYVSDVLPDCDEGTLDILMDAVAYLLPGMPFRDRFRIVCSLIAGDAPKEFQDAKMFQRLYDRLVAPKGRAQRFGGQIVAQSRPQLNEQIVALFSRHNQTVLATRAMQRLATMGEAKFTLELAESELTIGKSDRANDYLKMVWDQVGGNRLERNLSADATYAAKALVLQWSVAQRQGDVELARELEQQLQLTLCSPSTELRNEVAEYLADHGRMELAQQVFDSLLPMSVYGSMEVVDLYDVARNYSTAFKEVDPGQAAKWFDLALTTIAEVGFGERAYVSLPMFAQRWAVEGAIKDGDQSLARMHYEKILRLDPLNIDFAERLLPEMRENGMTELADEAFDTVFEVGLQHTKDYPFDATACNNVAWVAAMNGRRLDEALELSRHACFVEPDSAVFRDTLAEILYRLDRIREALLIEESCVLDDPGEWHLHEQIKKYRGELAQQEQ